MIVNYVYLGVDVNLYLKRLVTEQLSSAVSCELHYTTYESTEQGLKQTLQYSDTSLALLWHYRNLVISLFLIHLLLLLPLLTYSVLCDLASNAIREHLIWLIIDSSHYTHICCTGTLLHCTVLNWTGQNCARGLQSPHVVKLAMTHPTRLAQ